MKTKLLILPIVLLFTVAGLAQSNVALSLHTGYTMSAFSEFEEKGLVDDAPLIGFNVGYELLKGLELGGGFNYVIGGFKFEMEDDEGSFTLKWEYILIGLYGKYSLNSGSFNPFVKVGVGYFLGDNIIELEGVENSFEVDNGIGFIFGGGIQHSSGIFAEFNYNIVTRNYFNEDFDMNTWAVFIGYHIKR